MASRADKGALSWVLTLTLTYCTWSCGVAQHRWSRSPFDPWSSLWKDVECMWGGMDHWFCCISPFTVHPIPKCAWVSRYRSLLGSFDIPKLKRHVLIASLMSNPWLQYLFSAKLTTLPYCKILCQASVTAGFPSLKCVDYDALGI